MKTQYSKNLTSNSGNKSREVLIVPKLNNHTTHFVFIDSHEYEIKIEDNKIWLDTKIPRYMRDEILCKFNTF